MLKKLLFSTICLALSLSASFTSCAQQAVLSPAQQWFTNVRYGMFIHWGLFSIPADGEWVMNTHKITAKNYALLADNFYPFKFNADDWVRTAKQGGMKYVTLVTRHHDGFSLFATKYSSFNVINTPYGKDVVAQVAAACKKYQLKLFLYYSLLDWKREDYQWTTGRTGQFSGRPRSTNWPSYIAFMKNQLTELLTNYGPIGGIWLDGYWDQMDEESATRKDDEVRVNWHMKEIYDHIHKLQPQCLIGNNHHMSPLPGEDFQMFEQDLPGGSTSGLNFQKPGRLPIETCATVNDSWGFNLRDTSFKSVKQITDLLVRAAGYGGNLLLNVGPMPNGQIQETATQRIIAVGQWLQTYGPTIYNTRGGYIKPQAWGAITTAGNKVYVHVLKPGTTQVTLPQYAYSRPRRAYTYVNKQPVRFTYNNKSLSLQLPAAAADEPDQVIVIE